MSNLKYLDHLVDYIDQDFWITYKTEEGFVEAHCEGHSKQHVEHLIKDIDDLLKHDDRHMVDYVLGSSWAQLGGPYFKTHVEYRHWFERIRAFFAEKLATFDNWGKYNPVA